MAAAGRTSGSWWTAERPTRCSRNEYGANLGLEPMREMDFVLADGTTLRRAISECQIELPQGTGHTPVVLGESRDEALLGVVTLEELALVFNRFERTLQRMKVRLT